MLTHDPITVGLVADLSIRVPRSAPGDLIDGTRQVIDAVDAVTHVESVEVSAVTPNLNDLFVEVTVEATVTLDGLDGDAVESARSALLAGFGIDAVDAIDVDRNSPALEHE